MEDTLDEAKDAQEGMKQLATFTILSKDWHALINEMAQSNGFKVKYEANGIVANPFPVFYPVKSEEEALALMKEGMKVTKDTVKFFYVDPNMMTVDYKNSGIFWSGTQRYVGALVNDHSANVYNDELINRYQPNVENYKQYEQSKMPLVHYIQQRAKGKKLKETSDKYVTYHVITAEPTTEHDWTDLINDYRDSVSTTIETPLSANRFIKKAPDNKFPIHVEPTLEFYRSGMPMMAGYYDAHLRLVTNEMLLISLSQKLSTIKFTPPVPRNMLARTLEMALHLTMHHVKNKCTIL